ncbi:hypothetical protein [Mycobacterium kubicae]|uniref:Uncharacterized protein n=1 Tax=Mycobacterium kubicae TaxID=120959 RepID=A0AAX1JD35_9MYCO|nr:hypothetical protein [Mycobacterium kubicae]MCV7097852.1 hypothetical protein [Mycobacterium kubicae]QNI10250.1 hypothetical protein GAN18_02575 [Mycobacterium kubicae]QPI38455.1 hypothetical protein I2456_02555 [Mycobacterium kubicae]
MTKGVVSDNQGDERRLLHFDDTWSVKIELRDPDSYAEERRGGSFWLLNARVIIANYDDSAQVAEARLLWIRGEEELVIDKVRIFIPLMAKAASPCRAKSTPTRPSKFTCTAIHLTEWHRTVGSTPSVSTSWRPSTRSPT